MWDLALVRDDSTLISCGAEGAVKVWEITTTGGKLKLSWSYHGLNDDDDDEMIDEGDPEDTPGATAVEAIKIDLKRVAVAYQNTVVKIFDIETGKEEMKLQPEIVAGRSSKIWRLKRYTQLIFFQRKECQRRSMPWRPILRCLFS